MCSSISSIWTTEFITHYKGDNYHIIYGYGIDSSKETWDNCKVRYLGKRAAWKVDNLYTRLITK